MNRKNLSMTLVFVMVALLLSIAVAADAGGSASAHSTGASAYAWSDVEADLLARARITSLLYIANDTNEGMATSASASVSSSDLNRVDEYPPTASYATAWVGDYEYDWESWSS